MILCCFSLLFQLFRIWLLNILYKVFHVTCPSFFVMGFTSSYIYRQIFQGCTFFNRFFHESHGIINIGLGMFILYSPIPAPFLLGSHLKKNTAATEACLFF